MTDHPDATEPNPVGEHGSHCHLPAPIARYAFAQDVLYSWQRVVQEKRALPRYVSRT